MTLGVQFGQGADATQWWLGSIDKTVLPNPLSQSPVADALTSPVYMGPWSSAVLAGGEGSILANTNGSGAHSFDVTGQWRTVKNVSAYSSSAETVSFDGFVHVDVRVGQIGHHDSHVSIYAAKRANVITGAGDDTVDIYTANNIGNVSDYRITTGNGDDVVVIHPFDIAAARVSDPVTYGVTGGPAMLQVFDGSQSNVYANLGNGNDTFVGLASKDYVQGGQGGDLLIGNGGDDRLDGGSDRDFLYGGAGNDFLNGGTNSTGCFPQLSLFSFFARSCHHGSASVPLAYLSAEAAQGGDGDDTLVSVGRGSGYASVNDGSDILTGGAGADKFFFSGKSGNDVVTDFVAGAANADPSANAGDRLLFGGIKYDNVAETVVSHGSSRFTFMHVNYDGGHDDLLVLRDQPSWFGSIKESLVLKDFFTNNDGVINTAYYDNTSLTATQVNALGSDSIINFKADDHTQIAAVLGNLYA